MFRSFAELGIIATGSAITMENFLQPGRLAKTGIDAGAPILEQIGETADFPEVFVNLEAVDAEKSIPHMLEAFMVGDRGFERIPRQA